VADVLFLPEANDDYQAAVAWYRGRSAQATAGFEAAVEVSLRAISDSPERWTALDRRHRFYALRRYPYSVIYRVEAMGVLVVAVAHSSRSASYWRDRS
jgi:plasmid stabilization system protein ParE